jgi:CRP/FNR family transcriptional regulator, cyclic AMP receptor protein
MFHDHALIHHPRWCGRTLGGFGDTPMLTDAEHQLLREVALFDGLAPEQAVAIAALLQRKTFPAGTNLMAAEQPGEVVYIILSGTVKIFVEQTDGSEVIIAILGAGDTVGEMSLIDSAGRSANVITQEESTLLWMDRSAFQESLRTAPVITYNLVRTLSSRLRLANEQIQALATLDVYGRVARQILAFAQKYGRADESGAPYSHSPDPDRSRRAGRRLTRARQSGDRSIQTLPLYFN